MKRNLSRQEYESLDAKLDEFSELRNSVNTLQAILPAQLDTAKMLEEFTDLKDRLFKIYPYLFFEDDDKRTKSESSLAKAISEKVQSIFTDLCRHYFDPLSELFSTLVPINSNNDDIKKTKLKGIYLLYRAIADSLIAKGLQGDEVALLSSLKSYTVAKLIGISKRKIQSLKRNLDNQFGKGCWWEGHCGYFVLIGKLKEAKDFLNQELKNSKNAADKFVLQILLAKLGVGVISKLQSQKIEAQNLLDLNDYIMHLKKAYAIFLSKPRLTNLYCQCLLKKLGPKLQGLSRTLSNLALRGCVLNFSIFTAYINTELIQLDINIETRFVGADELNIVSQTSQRLLKATNTLFSINDYQPFLGLAKGLNTIEAIQRSVSSEVELSAVALKASIEKVLVYCQAVITKHIYAKDTKSRTRVMSFGEAIYQLFIGYHKVFTNRTKVIFDLILENRDAFGPFIMRIHNRLKDFSCESELGMSDENRLGEEEAFFVYTYLRVLLHSYRNKYSLAKKRSITYPIKSNVINLKGEILRAQYQRFLSTIRSSLLKKDEPFVGDIHPDLLKSYNMTMDLVVKIEKFAECEGQTSRLLKLIKPKEVLTEVNRILQVLDDLLKKHDLTDLSFNAQFNITYFYCLKITLIYAFFIEKNEADGFTLLLRILKFGKQLYRIHEKNKKDLADELGRKPTQVIIQTWPTGELNLIKFQASIDGALKQITDLLFLFSLMGISPSVKAEPVKLRSVDELCEELGSNISISKNNNRVNKSRKGRRKTGRGKKRINKGRRKKANGKPKAKLVMESEAAENEHVEERYIEQKEPQVEAAAGSSVMVQIKQGIFVLPKIVPSESKAESQKDFTAYLRDIKAKSQTADKQFDNLLLLFSGVEGELTSNETIAFLKLLLSTNDQLTAKKQLDLDCAKLNINGIEEVINSKQFKSDTVLQLQIKTIEAHEPFSAETSLQKIILTRVVAHLSSIKFSKILHAQKNDSFKKELKRLRLIKRHRHLTKVTCNQEEDFFKPMTGSRQFRRVSSMTSVPFWFGLKPPTQVEEMSVYQEYKSKRAIAQKNY